MRILLATFLMSACFTRVQATDDLTQALRQEIGSIKSAELLQDTFPVFYRLVARLTDAAKIPMPQYVSVYDAEYEKVRKDGIVEKHHTEIYVHLDQFGDLEIAREIVAEATYNELEGLLAIAVAEKALSRLSKALTAGAATLAGSLIATFGLEKVSRLIHESASDYVISNGLFVSGTVALLASAVTGRDVQKSAVTHALPLTNPMHIRDGLNTLKRIVNKNYEPGFLDRTLRFLHLKQIVKPLFRAFSFNNDPEVLLQELSAHIELSDICD